LERLFSLRREELDALLQLGGGVVVVRVRPDTEAVEIAAAPPVRLTRYSFLPRASLVSDPHHLAFPQGLRFIPRRGRDISWIEPLHPLSEYLKAFGELGYEAVLAAALGAPLAAFGKPLAVNKVGDIVAWDLPLGTGRILFLPAFPGAKGRDAAEALLAALEELLEVPVPERAPDWLEKFPLPGEEELRRRWEEVRRAQEELAAEEGKISSQAREFAGLRGLLYPRGRYGLAQAVKLALGKLGFTFEEARGAMFLFRKGRKRLLVQVGLSSQGPVDAGPYRELLLALDELRTESGLDVHGLLVAVAEPRLDPRRRGPQWTEAVRRGCQEHGITLVSGYQLFKALAAALEGEQGEEVGAALLSAEGEWRWKP